MKLNKQINTLWDGAAALGILKLVKTLPHGNICYGTLLHARVPDSYHKILHAASAALLACSPDNQKVLAKLPQFTDFPKILSVMAC